MELEQQNRDLLKSMNERTRLQLRLQTTVEGLSVAAISYYVVALFDYLVKAADHAELLRIEPSYATAAFVPSRCWGLVDRAAHSQQTYRRNRVRQMRHADLTPVDHDWRMGDGGASCKTSTDRSFDFSVPASSATS